MDTRQRVAVVGIGGIFSRSPTLHEFWDNIAQARDTAREVPPGRWPLAPADVFDPVVPAPDKVYSTRGCFVDDFRADTTGLRIDDGLLDRLDPVFHLALHAAVGAWRDAGGERHDPRRVGAVFGNIVLPIESSSAIAEEILGAMIEEQITGRADRRAATDPRNLPAAGMPAAIVAQALGLGGGCFTLDAACASSLFALKLAIDKLLAGEADLMLTGGVSRPDCLYTQMGFSQLRALSPTGCCRPFDAAADGLVVGEGAGFLALRRLDDALRDGDHIYAVIAGVGLSNDTAGNLLAPDAGGQFRALRAAYCRAGWRPADVDLIECHGTGTAVGDSVELEGLRRLWDDGEWRPGQCVIGSVKSNVGHTLTAAGAAGLLKVILALREGVLPPTANFSTPRDALAGGPFRVLRQAEPWQPRCAGEPRRAAVSAFGFGGTNAHVLLEEWREGAKASVRVTAEVPRSSECPVAVVGMEAHFGPWRTLRDFQYRIFGSPVADHSPSDVAGRWWGFERTERFRAAGAAANDHAGYYIDTFSFPLDRFRIAPRDLEEMLPQQLLMLQVAAEAFDRANLGAVDRNRVGVFIGLGLDLNTTNFHLRWLMPNKARRWNEQLALRLSGAELEAWVSALRQKAGPPLTAGRVLGALGSITASRIARVLGAGGPAFTVASEETSGLSALETAVAMLRGGEIDAAVVGAVDFPGDVRVQMCSRQRTNDTGPMPGEGAAAVILRRLEDAEKDGQPVFAVIRRVEAFAAADHAAVSPVADAERDVGCAGAAAGMASFVKAALALHHRILPPDAGRPACYWLHDRGDGPRRLTVTVAGVTGDRVSAVLEEGTAAPADARPLGPLPEALFIAAADDAVGLVHELRALRELAAAHRHLPIEEFARTWARQRPFVPSRAAVCSLIARDVEEIEKLVEQQVRSLSQPGADGASAEPASSERVFCNVGQQVSAGKVAFVFPGSGNHFAGMGCELSAHWPAVFRALEAENHNLRSQFLPEVFWHRPTLDSVDDQRTLLLGQVALGAAVSDLLRHFGVRPDAAIGYSLGESTALVALRVWADREEMWSRLRRSTLFASDLAGARDAARRAWGLAHGEPVAWQAGVVPCPAERVTEALAGKNRAYLLIINGPAECVIGGESGAVRQVVRELGCRFLPLPNVSMVHCPVAREVEQSYRELHLLPVQACRDVAIYSGAAGAIYEPTSEACADAITRLAVQTLDFARLIRRAYEDGVRVFVEVGPGASCTRMIASILDGRPHLARSACPAARDAVGAILRLLAELATWRVPVDPAALYADSNRQAEAAVPLGRRSLVVRVGRPPCTFQLPPTARKALPETSTAPSAMVRQRRERQALADRERHGGSLQHRAVEALLAAQTAKAAAHEKYLHFGQHAQAMLRAMTQVNARPADVRTADGSVAASATRATEKAAPRTAPAFDRARCVEFAVGALGNVLGPEYAAIDRHPTRVRLPAEPLMLVDRILRVEGKPKSLGSGRIVTEHDVLAEDWYLDNGRAPACIAIESGQADLFLSAYLGIDFHTRGLSMYRLLDATVTFHRGLPVAGEMLRYDITIDNFFRQGTTHLFRFHFEGTADDRPLLTMTNGCAGFFSSEELAGGKGIVRPRRADAERGTAARPCRNGDPFVPLSPESYDEAQLDALRAGDLAGCFGGPFRGLTLRDALTLPPQPMLRLIHRVPRFDAAGGAHGLGVILGEQDIHPDDWFLKCHFIDDPVMPGTLMYECCLHVLRIFLLRIGWVAEKADAHFEPKPGVPARLKCRGQVTAATRVAGYEITLKELGREPYPYAIADATMYADGKPIVAISDMSLQLTGVRFDDLSRLWQQLSGRESAFVERPGERADRPQRAAPLVFTREQVLTFARGRPSEAFGEPYRAFDNQRRLARLPGPPFSFLDRVVSCTAEPWQMKAGGMAVAEFDVQPGAWYFAAERQPRMPFSLLLEVALQACGWMSAYIGSALTSPQDLRFRNLQGKLTQLAPVTAETGTLSTSVKLTRISAAGGMILQEYEFTVRAAAEAILQGETLFGFFTDQVLAQQAGIREAAPHQPTHDELRRARRFPYPDAPPFPERRLRMIDHVAGLVADGGPYGQGLIIGTWDVDPDAWFFQAHFYQDPVCPGSLGMEAFVQLLKVFAFERFGRPQRCTFESPAFGQELRWTYRGQILPANAGVTVQAEIQDVDEERRAIRAGGWLSVDGVVIYHLQDFTLRLRDE